MIIRKPLTEEQKKKLVDREKPSQEEVNHAIDELFVNLMNRVDELERERQAK